jgi:hypothetical protein
VAGGTFLAIIGALALLMGAAELVLRHLRLQQQRAWVRRRLNEADWGAPEGATCPWPTLEPEVEELRRKALL